jgi:hypothetical protein
MLNEDAAITPPVVDPNAIPDRAVLPLAPEPRAFAEVLGREIAQRWAETQRHEADCSPTAPEQIDY